MKVNVYTKDMDATNTEFSRFNNCHHANECKWSVILRDPVGKNHPSCRTLKPTGCKKSQVFQLFKSLTSLIFLYTNMHIYVYNATRLFFGGAICVYIYICIFMQPSLFWYAFNTWLKITMKTHVGHVPGLGGNRTLQQTMSLPSYAIGGEFWGFCPTNFLTKCSRKCQDWRWGSCQLVSTHP